MYNGTPVVFDEPGTYEVRCGEDKIKVQADSLDYNGPNGDLRALKDGKVIATWNWWNSVVRVGD